MKKLLLACLLLAGCTSGEPFRNILPEDFELRTGDVVFRRGGGFTSKVVLAADVNGEYSHIGIVVDSAGTKMIVHAVPDEPDYEGDEDRVKMEAPERFFSTQYTLIGEVCTGPPRSLSSDLRPSIPGKRRSASARSSACAPHWTMR